MKTLRVLARETARGPAMVFDLESHENGVRRYVGRKHDRTLGASFVDDAGNAQKQGGWPPSHTPANPDVVPYRAEYGNAVRDGSLWAADEETAAHCGVVFDPTFGGDYDHVRATAPEPETAPASPLALRVLAPSTARDDE